MAEVTRATEEILSNSVALKAIEFVHRGLTIKGKLSIVHYMALLKFQVM